MMVGRYLIVNADDFGQSAGVNRGVIEAHERGLVTSASLMVRWPASSEAAAFARRSPHLSLGLHLDVAEWVCRNGTWAALYQVVSLDDTEALREEVARQLGVFRDLTGQDPTHLDSHQHVHRGEPLRSILIDTATLLGVPLRGHTPSVRYCGAFYGQTADGLPVSEAIGVDALLRILCALPPGVTELGCHPGRGVDLDTMYGVERSQEVDTLCDTRVRASAVALGIELCSFRTAPAGVR